MCHKFEKNTCCTPQQQQKARLGSCEACIAVTGLLNMGTCDAPRHALANSPEIMQLLPSMSLTLFPQCRLLLLKHLLLPQHHLRRPCPTLICYVREIHLQPSLSPAHKPLHSQAPVPPSQLSRQPHQPPLPLCLREIRDPGDYPSCLSMHLWTMSCEHGVLALFVRAGCS